ncbi:MAG: mRNA surveillance protein pelota [Crenarchaeota archaeon]|nr:mRNA surveillance protein pelota [Thermoproteota archaeon]MDW8033880.1 mRNA surveillance protein pelota [Nitrososphaerota archaeon]
MIKVDYSKCVLEIRPFSGEELWKVYHLIDKGDRASAETTRIIKVGEDEKSRRKVFMKIIVENIEFDISSEIIRLKGRVLECPEDVEGVKGHYHTLSIGIGDRLILEKQEISPIHEKILNQDVNTRKLVIVAVELGVATIAIVKDYGVVESTMVEQDIVGKNFPERREASMRSFFREVLKVLEDFWVKEKPRIILIGPSIIRDYFLSFLEEERKDIRNSVVGCFHAFGGTISAVNDFLRSGEMKVVAKELKIIDEIEVVEYLFKSIAEEKAVYGVEETWRAIEKGAVDHLIIHVKLASRSRDLLNKLAEMMRLVEAYGGKVTIVSGRHESADKLNSIGGIGALLRYRFY